MKTYEPVIGLEVHVELKTKSKMFCGCSADYFGKEPNTHTCPVCLGLPGALPVPNKTAIEWCVKIGLALNCKIPLFSKFDRKNYFYPDLPKGYQISQYDEPFAINGYIDLKSETYSNDKNSKRIRIRRVHMEEDTAKLIHQFGIQNSKFKIQNSEEEYSFIDFNRSGVPLVEIVTEPDFRNTTDVVLYLKKLHQIVQYLGVSNADLEKGDMRMEPNISLRLKGQTDLPKYKVEIKNINSFRFVLRAITKETNRQTEILEKGEIPVQETRGWHEAKQKTVSQRVKEEENDYRYFPEPDIPPIRWAEFQISNFKFQMPEMPDVKLKRFQKDYQLSSYDSEILVRKKATADYFEDVVRLGRKQTITPKQIANVIINKKIEPRNVQPDELIKQISSSSAKLPGILSDEDLVLIDQVIKNNPTVTQDYKKGKQNAIMFLVGQFMKHTKHKANPQLVRKTLEEKLAA